MKKRKDNAFGKEVYLLGKDENGTNYWLEEASWDCEWYWGFGYVETYTNNEYPSKSGDIESHQHFDGLFLEKNIFVSFKQLLIETPLNDKEIWQLLELMQTYYTLRKMSDMLHSGGSNISTDNSLSKELKNKKEYDRINGVLLPKLFKEVYKMLSPERS